MTWLIDHIDSLADRDAIADSTGDHTYSELATEVNRYQEMVGTQIMPGDIVVILSDYNFHAIALFLMLVNKKCIIVPIVSKVQEEIDNRIDVSSGNKIIQITSEGALAIELRSQKRTNGLTSGLIDRGQAGLILFSSGSTGEPKAMIHNLDTLVDSYQEKRIKKLNMLVFLMFDHIGGLNTLLNTLSMGAHIILPSTRAALEIAALIEKYNVHVLPASPTFLNMMLMADVANKYDLSSLKMITYGTEPMPESLLRRLRKNFPKTRLLQTFGTSETGIVQTSSRSSGSLEMKLDDPNQEYKVVDGELWLRSKTQVLGYLNAKMDCFTEDGWFCTGDLVDELDDGYIRIIGRVKEVINVGGEKVLPAEIESVLMEMEIILDALVHGVQNAITGQSVVADIVLADGVEPKLAKKEIRKYCRTRLSKFKVPTKFVFLNKTNVSDRFKKIRLK
jgi:acyl-coenzyme A synthetase/AMP-(fatty) acid ligase